MIYTRTILTVYFNIFGGRLKSLIKSGDADLLNYYN